MIDIAPSLLSADFARLGEQIAQVENAGATLLHVDVMDGQFVPNITMGPLVVEAVRRASRLPLDCHLMIIEPQNFIEDFARAGADMISVHVEATPHLHRLLTRIRELGCQPGIAINPATPLALLEDALEYADYVLIMSVNPGFGGQSFIRSSLTRVRRTAKMVRDQGLETRIEIDGGISTKNLAAVIDSGAEVIVAGSAIFATPDPASAVRAMLEIARGSQLKATI
jgi:ribulose-phosphate 3-epimerase